MNRKPLVDTPTNEFLFKNVLETMYEQRKTQHKRWLDTCERHKTLMLYHVNMMSGVYALPLEENSNANI